MVLGALLAIGLVVAFGLWIYVTGARREAAPAPSSTPRRDADAGERDDVAPATAVVVLAGNVWSACAFDGHEEEWARFTSSPVRGFSGVPSGRHRVVTTCPSGEVATLDFVLYPGDVFARRLDPAAARWGPCEDDADAAPAPADALVIHRTVLGVARAMRGDAVVIPDLAVKRTRAALADLFTLAASAGPDDAALAKKATALGEALVGVPLTRRQLAVLVDEVATAAGVHAAAKEWDRVQLVVRLGLAVLPGDPHLLAQVARFDAAARIGTEGTA